MSKEVPGEGDIQKFEQQTEEWVLLAVYVLCVLCSIVGPFSNKLYFVLSILLGVRIANSLKVLSQLKVSISLLCHSDSKNIIPDIQRLFIHCLMVNRRVLYILQQLGFYTWYIHNTKECQTCVGIRARNIAL